MNKRALLLLGALTTIVPELFTSSTPIVRLVSPGTLFFLVIGYALPIIAIRELAVRRGIGTAGVFCFGLAYGILNEGLFARTLVAVSKVPIPQYTHYGQFYGFNLPWCAHILLWHSLSSVLIPIAIAHLVYPSIASKPWLSPVAAGICGVFAFSFGVLAFTHAGAAGGPGSPLQLWVMILFSALLYGAGMLCKGDLFGFEGGSAGRPLAVGIAGIVPTVIVIGMASAKAALPIYFAVVLLMVIGTAAILKKMSWHTLPGFVAVGIGWYIQTAFVGVVVIAGNAPLAVITAAVDIVIMKWMWRKIGSAEQVTASAI
jgi:hypothetical protein